MADEFWQAYQSASKADQERYDAIQNAAWEADRTARGPIIAKAALQLRPLRRALEVAERDAVHEYEATRTRVKSELAAAGRKAKEELASATRLKDSKIETARKDYSAASRPILDTRREGTNRLAAERDQTIRQAKLDVFGVAA